MTDKLALYFGCWDRSGHFLHYKDGKTIYWPRREIPGIPWDEGLMDGTLLKNGKVDDVETGEVHWTSGGRDAHWHAFYWWDRSVDKRGACNSGFYVRGFEHGHENEAFAFACEAFPTIVKRQHFPLRLIP